jgi:N-acetylglutamate synthase-like GNAT family acetyltransferase
MTGKAIRPANPADLGAIRRLVQAEGMPLFDLESFIDTFWVMDAGGEVAGCVGLEQYGTSALLRSIVVAPAARGTGAGHRLTLHWLEEARARAAETAYLFTMDKAPFFVRYGFEPCGMDDFHEDMRRSTQHTAMRAASPEFVKLVTPMRLRL